MWDDDDAPSPLRLPSLRGRLRSGAKDDMTPTSSSEGLGEATWNEEDLRILDSIAQPLWLYRSVPARTKLNAAPLLIMSLEPGLTTGLPALPPQLRRTEHSVGQCCGIEILQQVNCVGETRFRRRWGVSTRCGANSRGDGRHRSQQHFVSLSFKDLRDQAGVDYHILNALVKDEVEVRACQQLVSALPAVLRHLGHRAPELRRR